MNRLEETEDIYRSVRRHIPLWRRAFPSLFFQARNLAIIFHSSLLARRGRYGMEEFSLSSLSVLRALEGVGVDVEVTGLVHVRSTAGPCVLIANHMSTLETFVLPGLVVPIKKDFTFVVKQSLLDYPVFGPVMRAVRPIAVGRKNPRDDLKVVLEEGDRRLGEGCSVAVFPQTTRYDGFDPAKFNSIGIKLARRAGVPVVPVAIKSDAWESGRIIKDLGRIDPSKAVRFSFGTPMMITGRGDDEHRLVMEFISSRLREWGAPVSQP